MKNIFNWKRFTMVVQKDARDLRSQYLKLILIVACTFLVIFLFFAFSENSSFADYEKTRLIISSIFVCVCTLLAPFQLYKRFNQKIHGVNYFMLPASQAEKWTSMFSHCVIITPIVIILSITLIDLCLYPFFPWDEKRLWIAFFYFPQAESRELTEFISMVLSLLSFQSLGFLGNIWFQRAKMQKTIVTTIILLIAHGIFIVTLWKLFGGINTNPNIDINIDGFGVIAFKNAMNTLGFPAIWSIISMTISCLVAPIGLWAVSFMKMKEQQL